MTASRKLKVLLVSPMPPPEHGGIINWTRVVCRELHARPDLELAIVDTTPLHFRYPRLKLKWLGVLNRLLFGSLQAMRSTWHVNKQLRRFQPDVLHLNSSGCWGTARDMLILRLARRWRVPCILHYHLQKPPAEIANRRFFWWWHRCAMAQADMVVLLDTPSRSCVRAAFPGKKTALLSTMVEVDVVDRLAPTTPRANESIASLRIVFTGFVAPYKGVRDLVEACARLADRPLRLDLVGPIISPAFRKELEAMASHTGTTDWLHFHGAVAHEEVFRRMMAADLFVLPSYGESAPTVVLEAMSCRKPVVSTRTGAIPEMLDIDGPQQCGLCVSPGNVEELAGAIQRLWDNPELREHWGRIGRERVEKHYTVPVGCRQLVDVWRYALERDDGGKRGD